MSFTIVFPSPPPTSNTLTAQQRVQLLRTTKKLERVLGAVPHFIDTPTRNEPSRHTSGTLHKRSRSVCSTYSSLSSDSSLQSDTHSTSPILRRGSSLSSTVTSRKRLLPAFSRRMLDDDLYKMQLPVLHLSIPTLESIPASPVSPGFSSPSESSFSDDSLGADSTAPFHVRPSPSPRDDETTMTQPPNFTIPSNNSLRRQKLNRVRRRLGDGVPLELVFAHEKEDDEEASSLSSSDSDADFGTPIRDILSKDLASPPPPPYSPTDNVKPNGGRGTTRISSTRDSLILMKTLPNRAPNKVKRKPVPTLNTGIVASRPAPPPPTQSSRVASATVNVHVSRSPRAFSMTEPQRNSKSRARLSLIMESPDEYGNTVVEEVEVSLVSGKAALSVKRASKGFANEFPGSWLDLGDSTL